MKWMRERDLLIAQTMEFVQSVTGKKPEAENTVATSASLLPVADLQPRERSRADARHRGLAGRERRRG